MSSVHATAQVPFEIPRSIAHSFLERVEATPHRAAFMSPSGDGWATLTWEQAHVVVTEIAAGLLDLGIELEDRVAIASSTRTEWILADLGIMCAGGATTTIYPTTQESDVAYILADAGARVVIAENAAQADKVAMVKDQLPDLQAIVVIDRDAGDDLDGDVEVLSMASLRSRGLALLRTAPHAVRHRVDRITGDHLATLIYTSGTTGRPKGVELPHRCWAYEGVAIERLGILTVDDLQYLWLPLAHSFGKVLISVQLQIGFPSAVDGRLDRIMGNLASIRPTFVAAVPRVFEKIHAKVVSEATGHGGLKAAIFGWAFKAGEAARRPQRLGLRSTMWQKTTYAVADRLVFGRLQAALGGRIRYLVSGSAPLSPDIAMWFDAAGLQILEGYGLTESSAASTLMRPGHVRFGTVGPAVPGTELRIADDGEVLIKGPGVMRGYWNLADETAQALDDGWLRTGDVGELDDQGRLRITDRKKDLVKTSGGKYIAPSAIESRFKAICGLVSNMLVHVDGRNYATALLTLDPEATTEFAQSRGIEGEPSELSTSPVVLDEIAAAIAELNAGLNRWETIKDFRVLDHDFSVEGGELTPSLKLKRRIVEERYSTLLDSMYA